jgi:hypothetical protein
MGLTAIPTQAATEDEIEGAIQDGVEWLVTQQDVDGSWGDYPWDINYEVGLTAFAVLKLEDRAYELDLDPFDEDYPYSENVIDGLNFIFGEAHTEGVCAGVQLGDGHHENYATGTSMMAIAGSRHPEREVDVPGSDVDGWTYLEVMEGAVEWCEATQRAGSAWGYGCGETPERADNSNSGWTTLGLRYAETYFSLDVSLVKPDLDLWIDYIQNDINGDVLDGGSGYEHPDSWVNLLKTGNLLFQMDFVGDDESTPRVQDAIDYIERHWLDANPDPGFRSQPPWYLYHHYQAMYCLMKGLESLGIDTIDVGGPIDWYEEFAEIIVSEQQPNGSWIDDFWTWDPIAATVWALLTLEKVVPPIEVPVDIKPMSCPNPINTGQKGLIPVAILGTEDFDVATIDPAGVRLEGVAPLRWAYEDVATPYEPYIGKEGAFACTMAGPDGYMDLSLKFKAQEVVAALGDVSDGDVLVLQLTGKLQEEYDGDDIIGEDVVIIIEK